MDANSCNVSLKEHGENTCEEIEDEPDIKPELEIKIEEHDAVDLKDEFDVSNMKEEEMASEYPMVENLSHILYMDSRVLDAIVQSRKKCNLKKKRLHKNVSKMESFDCSVCGHQFKLKGSHKRQLPEHNDKLEVQLYVCNDCSGKTKRKYERKKHSEKSNKDLSEIGLPKCSVCGFQTKWKGNLKKHLLIHKNPSKVVTHKCNLCQYQSKREWSLSKHMLTHRAPMEPSQNEIFRCAGCSFQIKWKDNFKKHVFLQSEMFECNICGFESGSNRHVVKHLLEHRDQSSTEIFKCTECSY